jgi:hypothetical protein
MHPTAALMLTTAIEEERRRAAEHASRRMDAIASATQPRRSPLSLALGIPRRLKLSSSKA